MNKKLIRKVLTGTLGVSINALSPLLSVVENYCINTHKRTRSIHAPIFIVGAPRTGSTILYQAITNYFSVQYLNNVTCMLNRNILFGSWLSEKLYKGKPHNSFKAYFGSTKSSGGNAPSECGSFWYRWLPTENHYVESGQLPDTTIDSIRQEIHRVSEFFDRPIIFKNLNAGQRLGLVHQLFPDAKIIYIQRDPRYVVRSILDARSRLGIDEHVWWSIKPKNYKSLLKLSEQEMCVAQVYYLQKQIEDDLSHFHLDNVKKIKYQELSATTVKNIGSWLNLDIRTNGTIPEFHNDKLSDQAGDIVRLSKIIDCYDFERDIFI